MGLISQHRLRAGCALALAGLGVAGCGSGSTLTKETKGDFTVNVAHASFPKLQHVAADNDLVLTVKNTDSKEIPQLVVTLWTGDAGANAPKPQGSFASDGGKPVWVSDKSYPRVGESTASLRFAGGEAAPTDSFVFGALPAGKSRTMVWRVAPVRKGSYTLNYAIGAGADGRAKAVADGGAEPTGKFSVTVSPRASGTCVLGDGADYTGKCE